MKQRLINIILLVTSFLISLCFSELIVRVLLPSPPKIIIKQSPDFRNKLDYENRNRLDLSLSQNSLQENTGVLIWTPTGKRLRANTHVIIENHLLNKRTIEIHINSLGYRNRELSEKKKKRILFLGDSITLGDYLNEEETFVRLIETYSKQLDKDWETINSGVNGISLMNELAILKETGIHVKPDVVVIGFYLNDFLESPGVYIPKLPRFLSELRLINYVLTALFKLEKVRDSFSTEIDLEKWKESFEKELQINSEKYNQNELAFNKLVLKHFRDWGGSWSYYAWENMFPLFEEFKRLSIQYQFKPVIVIFPVRYQVVLEDSDDYPQRQLKTIGHRLDIPVLDLLPILKEKYYASSEPLFYDQCHHTPYANKVIAKEVYDFLRYHID